MREVLEETGIRVRLVGERREDVEEPVQLHRPAGVQLENIGPGHQQIDLIYFATPVGPTEIHPNYDEDKVGWYGPEDWDRMAVNAEVRGWCERALLALEGRYASGSKLTALRIGAIAAIAAVGADELAVKPVHLRATDLAVLARRLQCFPGLRLLCLLLVHLLEYTYTVGPRHRRP